MLDYPINLLGQWFGSLYVEEKGPSVPNGPGATAQTWICRCRCGKRTQVLRQNLIKKRTKSCGCGINPIKYPGTEASLRALYSDYKTGAKQRALIFDLDLDIFRVITSQNCRYCGAEPSQLAPAKKGLKIPYIYNGVDRIDNEFGYTKENCAPCCFKCNRMKFKFSVDDFLAHARRIVEHSNVS